MTTRTSEGLTSRLIDDTNLLHARFVRSQQDSSQYEVRGPRATAITAGSGFEIGSKGSRKK
jgi:hypothetical protein